MRPITPTSLVMKKAPTMILIGPTRIQMQNHLMILYVHLDARSIYLKKLLHFGKNLKLETNQSCLSFRTRKCDIEDEMADAKKTTDALRKENDAVNKKVKVLKNQLQEKL